MRIVCKICGHDGENIWKDGDYYCASCGTKLDAKEQGGLSKGEAPAEVIIKGTCPICKNASNNTLRNGQGHCALCGSTFALNQYANGPRPAASPLYTVDAASKRAELERQKNNKLIWAIVWLIFFWPVSIYFFYKWDQLSKEIAKL